MNSDLFYLCKIIILWWESNKSNYQTEPEFVKCAFKHLIEMAINVEMDDEEDDDD